MRYNLTSIKVVQIAHCGFKFKLIVIDEVGHLPDIQYLIDEVLLPTTALRYNRWRYEWCLAHDEF